MRFTLVSDGPADQALVPILTWSLQRQGVAAVEPQWADPRRIPNPPRQLAPKIRVSMQLFPCELLFVHRDAEAQPFVLRLQEIDKAIEEASAELHLPPVVRVVPVRMTEAWLLLDELAIRTAAHNPNGAMALNLPNVRDVENLLDPKAFLLQALSNASGLGARRRRSLNVRSLVHQVTQRIEDFSVLDEVPAYARFAEELATVLRENPFV